LFGFLGSSLLSLLSEFLSVLPGLFFFLFFLEGFRLRFLGSSLFSPLSL